MTAFGGMNGETKIPSEESKMGCEFPKKHQSLRGGNKEILNPLALFQVAMT